MYKTAILVLLYNKEIYDSETILSLVNLGEHSLNTKIIIWNNGPKPFQKGCVHDLEKIGYDIEIKETLFNESLAVIYNKFLCEHKAEKYILLDDDSTLTQEYVICSSLCGLFDVGMPVITSLGEIHMPKVNGVPYFSQIKLKDTSNVITIGSGLVIGNGIITLIKNKYKNVFDERFYLYGVDTVFCLRLNEMGLTKNIKFICGFEHSLSRLENESVKVKAFRRLERSYDIGLTLRYYTPLTESIFTILKLLTGTIKKRILKKDNPIFFLHLCIAFFKGKHYRNKSN